MTRILRRSDYPTHVPSLYPPPEIYPALAWQKKKKKKKPTTILTHSLKCSFPTSFTNVFLYDIVFLTDTGEL